jgi:hypothetical protein
VVPSARRASCVVGVLGFVGLLRFGVLTSCCLALDGHDVSTRWTE